MRERSLIDAVADRLTSEHFHEPLHGRIFDAILSLHSQGKTASPITLKPFFADDPAMIDLGGAVLPRHDHGDDRSRSDRRQGLRRRHSGTGLNAES
jgi:hypothetical protein